ncbi:MAG: glutamate--tRNA ligase [Chloroflexia bacterium]|nr:glutamate--tRNA ligase [Chloroflexia bacterium]
MAPSPTGLLHIGNVRTAIFDWLLARHHGGQFVLRVEDTDRTRLVPGSVEAMMDTLRWIGLEWDEGPEIGGPFGPYVQSERTELYRDHAERLVSNNTAYRCYCTAERLAALRAEQERKHQPTGYDRHCRFMSAEERAEQEASGDPSVIRFAVPLEGETHLTDALRGVLTYKHETVQDFVLLKSDGFPTYHFAVVIDDHLMQISHVVRGPEYLSTGARDTLLHQALGWPQPEYVHGSEILAPDRKRLAKRHGATAVLEFREMGFVPEALFNFLALLGAAYSGDREIFSREELVAIFDVDKLHPTPAIFDRTKLEWMNGHYINHILTLSDVTDRCAPYLERAGLLSGEPTREYVAAVIALVKDRVKLLPEVVELTDFFFREPEPSAAEVAGKKLTPEGAHHAIQTAHKRLEGLDEWDEAAMESRMRQLAEQLDLKAGVLFAALRIAITGKTVAPGLFDTMRVLGRERTLERLTRAAETVAAAPIA